MSAYIQAAWQGDCPQMISLLTTASWSPDGDITRDEATTECDRTVGRSADDARRVGLDREVVIGEVQVSGEGSARTVTVDRHVEYGDERSERPPAPDLGPPEPVEYELRREDGEWRIHVPDGVGLANEFFAWPN